MGRFRLNIGLRVAALAALLMVLATGAATWPPPSVDTAEQQRALASADAALVTAAQAVQDRSPMDWDAALPAQSEEARLAWREVYDGLCRYHWKKLEFLITPGDAWTDEYLVDAFGTLAGPTPTLAAERSLRLTWSGGDVSLVADTTPARNRGDFLLAFVDPLVLRADHLTVLGDRAQWRLMRRIVDADGQMRRVTAALGEDDAQFRREKTLVAVCATHRQAVEAAGRPEPDEAVGFRTGTGVYIIADRLSGDAREIPGLMRHELAHVVVPSFGAREYQPAILVEGLATEAEGDWDTWPLRRELMDGSRTMPLQRALLLSDLWTGQTANETDLAYLEGAALVRFIRQVWDLQHVRDYGAALASDKPITVSDVIRATEEVFGESWSQFFEEWSRFVRSMP